MKTNRRHFIAGAAGVSTAAILGAAPAVHAQKKYDDGASDTEIKIGNTIP